MITMTTNGDGSIVVTLNGQAVLQGRWTLSDAATSYSATAMPAALGPAQIVALRFPPGAINHVHQHAGAVAVHSYAIDGDDLVITSTITNQGPAAIQIPRLSGLGMPFGPTLSGHANTWNDNYIQAAGGTACMHPAGTFETLGAVYLDDGTFGVGIHTPSHLAEQKLFRVSGGTPTTVMCDFADSIGPCQMKTYSVRFHFVDLSKLIVNTPTLIVAPKWQSLLASYRADFVKQLGGLKYVPDDRACAEMTSLDSTWVTAENPYGFNTGRRFDTAEGTKGFINMVVPGLKAANGLGCIFWQLQGWNDRGCNYRTDFDVFPPAIAANVPTLVAAFKAAGLRVGLQARPEVFTERLNFSTDQCTPLDPDNVAQMASLWARFANAIGMGFDMFYLDSCTLTFAGFKIVQFLRKMAGPNVLFFCEQGSDVVTPFAGRYIEFDGTNESWTWSELVAINRWLCPGASYLCVPRKETVTPDVLGAMQFSALVQDYLISSESPALAAANVKYQKGGKNWV